MLCTTHLIIQPADQLEVTGVVLPEHNAGTLLGHQQAQGQGKVALQ